MAGQQRSAASNRDREFSPNVAVAAQQHPVASRRGRKHSLETASPQCSVASSGVAEYSSGVAGQRPSVVSSRLPLGLNSQRSSHLSYSRSVSQDSQHTNSDSSASGEGCSSLDCFFVGRSFDSYCVDEYSKFYSFWQSFERKVMQR